MQGIMQTIGHNNISLNHDLILEKHTDLSRLKYIAYTGQSELIHSILKNAPGHFIDFIHDKDILSQAIYGSIKKINEIKQIHNYDFLEAEKRFMLDLLDRFRLCCERNGNTPREYFESVIYTGETLISVNELDTAFTLLGGILNRGVNKFPGLMVDTINKMSMILSRQGNIEKSGELLRKLICHPYFISDRNQIPEIFHNFSQAILKQGSLNFYKSILFTGLKYFYTNSKSRRLLFDQVIRTYRNITRFLLSGEVTTFNKIIVLVHWCYYKVPDFGKIKLPVINKIMEKIFLAVFYFLNYIVRRDSIKLVNNLTDSSLRLAELNDSTKGISGKTLSQKKKILVTRAMGGIGDLLMMTPGLHALKQKNPKKEIYLAIPGRYFPVFENNPDVKLVDIEQDFFTHTEFCNWHNLTDCPASRVESMSAPKVKKNRIEIFASELGLGKLRLAKLYNRPRIILSQPEKDFANQFWVGRDLTDKKVIGIQLHSDESYRDYPFMHSIVENLSHYYKILVFDSEKITGFDFENVIKVHSLPLRKVFALINKCDAIIAPDSSFVHIAAAFDIPTVALFGPIDGKLRTKDYPYCKYVDARDELKCMPCWRNESIPCKLTGLRNSVCMESIPVKKIINELKKMID